MIFKNTISKHSCWLIRIYIKNKRQNDSDCNHTLPKQPMCKVCRAAEILSPLSQPLWGSRYKVRNPRDVPGAVRSPRRPRAQPGRPRGPSRPLPPPGRGRWAPLRRDRESTSASAGFYLSICGVLPQHCRVFYLSRRASLSRQPARTRPPASAPQRDGKGDGDDEPPATAAARSPDRPRLHLLPRQRSPFPAVPAAAAGANEAARPGGSSSGRARGAGRGPGGGGSTLGCE